MRGLNLFVLSLLTVTGCTFTMVGNAPKTEQAIAQTRTVNSTFAKSEQLINTCVEEGENLAAIRFHTNPVYLLASILTLGLYVPQNVTWWCGTEVTDCADGDQSEDCEPYVRAADVSAKRAHHAGRRIGNSR